MKLAVFWCERDRWALIRSKRVERRVGSDIVVAYGTGWVSRIIRRWEGESSTQC